MNVVYLGTSDFAVAVLQRLVGVDLTPSLVVTRPDRPKGRGRKLAAPPVALYAQAENLELYQPENINSEEAYERIAAHKPDCLCVCAFGALIGDRLLDSWEPVNVHPSLLPRWRGAAPIERAIMAGDSETGVSIMRLVAELDAGPVYLTRTEPIRSDDTYGTLSDRLAPLAGELLIEVLKAGPEPVEQSATGLTYAEKIVADDRTLNPQRTADELDRQVRALTPHIGARLQLPNGELLGVRSVAVSSAAFTDSVTGALVEHEGSLNLVCADHTALELLTVQPAGGKAMSGADYLRGYGSGA